ncbi:MAG: hypothetical protein M3Z66_13910 [Chloroflexota bacterium]|nr:hypothetical protein [Chloroflexota bacterium]
MNAHIPATSDRRRLRRDLLCQYVRLQRDLVDGDPATSAYQGTIHAFRQMGYALINSGFEDDLDRLLRIRVLDGGQAKPSPRSERSFPDGLQMIETRPAF